MCHTIGGGAFGGGRFGRLCGLVFVVVPGVRGGSFVGGRIGREERGVTPPGVAPRLFPDANVSSVSRIAATCGEGVRGLLFGEVFGGVLLFGDMEPRCC